MFEGDGLLIDKENKRYKKYVSVLFFKIEFPMLLYLIDFFDTQLSILFIPRNFQHILDSCKVHQGFLYFHNVRFLTILVFIK